MEVKKRKEIIFKLSMKEVEAIATSYDLINNLYNIFLIEDSELNVIQSDYKNITINDEDLNNVKACLSLLLEHGGTFKIKTEETEIF